MFAAIETNGATHVVIYIPHVGSEKSLPALASMLENNTQFIRSGYSDFSIVKPTMNIVLGDSYRIERCDEELIILTSDSVIGEDFVTATPEVFVNNAKVVKKKDEEISRLRTELSFVKSQLEAAREAVKAED